MNYQIELASKIKNGRCVGNEYVVTRRPDGYTTILSRHATREEAEQWIVAERSRERVQYYMPTRAEVEALQVGDLAPDCFGKLARVVEVMTRMEDVNGKLFVHYRTVFGSNATITGGFKEDTLLRHAGLSQTSAELNDIEREMRLERAKAEPRCGICGQVILGNEHSAVCKDCAEFA